MSRRRWHGTTSRPARSPAASGPGRALAVLGDVDDVAERWFAEETFVHYDEHAEHIAAFADDSRPPDRVEPEPRYRPARAGRILVSPARGAAISRPTQPARPSPERPRTLAATAHARRRRLHEHGGLRTGAGEDLVGRLGVRRTHRGGREPGRLHRSGHRRRVGLHHPEPGRRAARVLQRVQPPRHEVRRRHRGDGERSQGVRVPVPRLDVRPRPAG